MDEGFCEILLFGLFGVDGDIHYKANPARSKSAKEIIHRQNEILEAMRHIRVTRRGTLSTQSYPQRAKRKEGKGATGLYALWQGTVEGKRVEERSSANGAGGQPPGLPGRPWQNGLGTEHGNH